MPKQENIETVSNSDNPTTSSRPGTVSKGVNFKTGEGMRTGPWHSTKEATDYYDQLIKEDYDDELEL